MIGGVILIGAVLVLGVFIFGRGGGGSNSGQQATSPVVVALQAIPQGTTFAAGQPLNQFFGLQKMPSSAIPFGAYTSVNQVSDVVKSAGCQPSGLATCRGEVTTTETIYQGLPIVSGMFSSLGSFRVAAGPAFRIPYGYVGIGISFSDVNSVLNSIQPGDDIDLIASYNGPETHQVSTTQYAMNDLRVIGVGGPPPPPPGSTGSSGAASASGGTLLLMVRYQQALLVQHLKDSAGIWTVSAVLRSAKETDIPHFKTLPVTDRWFFVKTSNGFTSRPPY